MLYSTNIRKPYRTRTYIAADWDHDCDAVERLHEWNNNSLLTLSFTDAHELQQSRDTSLPCSIKNSLRERMNYSKQFILIVGEHTNSVTKGGCQYCGSYNSWSKSCARGHSVDYDSYVEYECHQAVNAGIDVVVLYKATTVDRSKCPLEVRYTGTHTAMKKWENGSLRWDYQAVKKALGQ